MPKGSNKFYAKDKIDVAQKIMELAGPGKVIVQEYIGDAQKFVIDKNIMPSDEPVGDAVGLISGAQDGKFARVYYDGKSEPIDQDTFIDESVYNVLPERFKTYKPNG